MLSQKADPFAGRWDIEVSPAGANASVYPDWMEVAETNEATTMRIQPRGGGAFAVTEFKVAGSHLSATWPHNNSKSPATTWDLDVTENRLSGTERRGGRVVAYLSGVRAPALDRKPPAIWSEPRSLFNGKDLAGWEPVGTAEGARIFRAAVASLLAGSLVRRAIVGSALFVAAAFAAVPAEAGCSGAGGPGNTITCVDPGIPADVA